MDTVALQRWDLYRVLAEPVRLRLLALTSEEELTIGELAELLGESQPNVSRHAAPLRQAGLLKMRKQGTRTLVRFRDEALHDPVVSDALSSGKDLCTEEGSMGRIDEILRARDAIARDYFAKASDEAPSTSAPEYAAYLAALAPLLPRRELAVDVGTGDGSLLELLSPLFQRVVGIDRSEAQMTRAGARVKARRLDNVKLIHGEYDDASVVHAVGHGADVAIASRVLHHAPKPARLIATLAELLRPGGALVILDYARHEDESMRQQADLWLGFEPAELAKFARAAGLEHPEVFPLSSHLFHSTLDAHLPWQVLIARKKGTHG